VNVLLWHVHGSWTTAFVQGPHRYIVPVVPGRGPAGRGRAETWDWPASVVERSPAELADEPVDVVVAQRPEDLDLACAWLGGRVPGRDVGLIYLEHNAPQGRVNEMCHPMRDRHDLVLVHVTHFNALFWDVGSTEVRVIEHGIVDPGHRYTGERLAAAVVVNEPVRRGRVTGTDLLSTFARHLPVHVFGMGTSSLGDRYPDLDVVGEPPQHQLHDAMSHRRVYLHPFRWTSLGLSLLEAMHLGMPVVALATTEVPAAVPEGAGVVSNRIDVLVEATQRFLADADLAQACGRAGREAALDRYGLARFLDDWNHLLEEVAP
jgi:glycosyltransferase involved in cell wall biosynthesis